MTIHMIFCLFKVFISLYDPFIIMLAINKKQTIIDLIVKERIGLIPFKLIFINIVIKALKRAESKEKIIHMLSPIILTL